MQKLNPETIFGELNLNVLRIMFKLIRKLDSPYRWLAISYYWFLFLETEAQRIAKVDKFILAVSLCKRKVSVHDPYINSRMIVAVAAALAMYETEMSPARYAAALSPYAKLTPKRVSEFKDKAINDAAKWYAKKSKAPYQEALEQIYMYFDAWFPGSPPSEKALAFIKK